jgi:toxin-antitoxin system PIN domain toxin
MRALLDVNVLIALFDRAHVHHDRAKVWLASRTRDGWASCPITQNGFVRVISQPKYPKPVPTSQAIEMLRSATATELHEFWPADASLLSETIHGSRLHGSRQVTDIYLLALAIQHGGCLATFDEAISLSAVVGARPKHLIVI